MIEKLLQLITGKNGELRERMFRTIILFGGAATILGTAESFFVMKIDGMLLAAFIFLILAMAVTFFVTFKYQKYNVAAMILFLLIVGMMFPILFFPSGGIYGATPVWFSLGVLYVFIMFTGKRMIICLLLCAAIYGATYWMAFRYPELVTPMASESTVYIDSYFGIIAVGLVGGLILKAHIKVFEMEHKQNIAQKEEIERSRDSQNAFFANMSHEIRTPINTIIGLNEMILRESDSEEIKAYAKDIKLASDLLLAQVNDILDLSQMEMQKMKLVPVTYRTEDFFGELVELVRVRMERKGLRFLTDIDQNIPSALNGDVKRLKQVLINLLDNALKYTEEGSVVLSAAGEDCGNDEIRLKISVTDSGIGIRKEDMDYIYDSFNRVDEKRNIRILGSGLGLAISKQLIDLMEGEITVDSVYTKGSTFTVIVRQKIEDRTPVGEIHFRNRSTQEGEFYRPCFEAPEARILIVDDNPMNVKVATSLLSETKVQVDTASGGAECLEMTKKHYYHVILLDYMMPGMNGTETLTAIRKQENGLCRMSDVIAMTANSLAGAKELYQKQGFDGYVEKPILGRSLEAEILKHLPKDIIEYEEEEIIKAENIPQIQRASIKKRKKVYITADSTCDLPEELLEKYDIKLLYLYIQTPHGRFVDTKEIDSDSLNRYISAESSSAYPLSVPVEEFEEFFAEALTQAEQVIHISLSSKLGRVYQVADAAAKSFDHVHLIDSGQISCGEGMLVLHAAKLAMEGVEAEEICKELERMKENVRSRFIMKSAGVYRQTGYIQNFAVTLCKMFNLHPLILVKQKKVVPETLLCGTLENVWRRGIHKHLRKKKKIDTRVVIITHVSCSVKQLNLIVKEIKKCVPFERVIIQKASLTNACSVGMEAIGISYYSQ